MGAVAELEHASLEVEPGGEITTRMRVRNTGSVVDEFSFEPLGDAAAWIEVEPETLRLFPDGEDDVTVRLHPPRSPEVTAGALAFGVRVASQEDPEGSIVEEGTLEVLAFSDVSAELVPRTSKGRRKGSHDLAVDNRGNRQLNAEVLAYDEADALEFDIDSPGIVADPGTAIFTGVDVRPRDRFWRGPNETNMFTVEIRPEDAPPLTVDGTMVQEAMIPAWLPRALLALLLLILALLALWFTVLRPSVESAAREAVEEPLEELAAENQAQNEQIEQAQEQAGAADDKANQALAGDGETPSPSPSPSPAGPEITEASFDQRLSAVDPAGGAVTRDTVTLADGETLELSDVILENPRGHVGFVRITRGDDVLLEQATENFRSLDFHFVTPVTFLPGQELRFEVECEEPADDENACDAAAYVSGTLTTVTEEGAA